MVNLGLAMVNLGRVDTADGVLPNYHKDKGLNYVAMVILH